MRTPGPRPLRRRHRHSICLSSSPTGSLGHPRDRMAELKMHRNQQVQSGTVVNQDIVGGDGKDWYMVAQHGLKGTSCPSHYYILRDDVGHEPKHLQRLTFELCHLYAR